jgi:hypothetical protein
MSARTLPADPTLTFPEPPDVDATVAAKFDLCRGNLADFRVRHRGIEVQRALRIVDIGIAHEAVDVHIRAPRHSDPDEQIVGPPIIFQVREIEPVVPIPHRRIVLVFRTVDVESVALHSDAEARNTRPGARNLDRHLTAIANIHNHCTYDVFEFDGTGRIAAHGPAGPFARWRWRRGRCGRCCRG